MVNNTLVKQLTSLGVDRIITKHARKAASGNIESCKQQFLQNYFLQDDHHGFLEDVEVILIDKTDPIKREYYWKRNLKALYPDGFNLGNDYLFLGVLVSCICLSPLAFLGKCLIVDF